MNIILVRHGQTNWNVKDLLQGKTDIELNETGEMQAVETANKLINTEIDVIYVSPLKRTLKTAKQINKTRNLEMITDNRLIERGFGKYEGKSNVEFRKYWDFEANISDNNVEAVRELFSRTYSLLKEIAGKYKKTNKTILIVTHNGVNLAITSILKGLIPNNIFDYNLKTCEYRVFKDINLEQMEEFREKYKI